MEEEKINRESKLEEYKTRLIVFLKTGQIGRAIEIRDSFNFSEEILLSPEVKEATKEGMDFCLKNGQIDSAVKIIEKFNLPEDIVQEAAKEGMSVYLKKNWINDAVEISKKFKLPEGIVQEIAKTQAFFCIKKSWIDEAVEISKKFKLPEDVVQEITKKWMTIYFLDDQIDKAVKTSKKFNLSEGIVQEAAKAGIIICLNGGRIYRVVEIIEKFNLPEEIILSPEVQEAAKEGVAFCAKRALIDRVVEIIEKFNLPEEIILSPEVQEAVKEGMDFCFRRNRIDTAVKISKKIKLPEDIVQEVVKEGMDFCLKNGQIDSAVKIIEKFNLPEDIVQEATKEEIIICLNGGRIDRVVEIIEKFNLPEEIILSPEVQEAAKEGVAFCAKRTLIDRVVEIIEKLNLSEEIILSPEVQEAAKEGVTVCLKNGLIDSAVKIIKKFNLSEEEVFDYWQKQNYIVKTCSDILNIDNFDEFSKLYQQNKIYFKWLKDNNKNWIFSKQDFETSKKLSLPLHEIHLLVESGIIIEDLQTKDNAVYKRIYSELKSEAEEWQDEENVSSPFERGAELFGHYRMFEYLGRDRLSRHDGLHNFNKIIEMVEMSGLSAEQFYTNILDQVRRDGANYDTGVAHHELNNLANNIRRDIIKTIKETLQYKDIDKLQILAADLDSPAKVFASWKNLKKYGEMCSILGRREIFDQLQELKAQGKHKLYKFVETLAFHPNVSMEKVFQFWRDPEAFLDLADDHTPEEVHDRKKPSNYVDIPNLDLDAEKLRDAQVEGDLDSLQAFRPLEIQYELPAGEYTVIITRDLIKQALGQRGRGAKAKNPKVLFPKVVEWFREHEINLQDFVRGKIKLELENSADEEELRAILQDDKIGYTTKLETVEYRAKINLKSDPDGVVAGNDTACCMPFGSGKNNVYTFNPITSLFTLQQKRGDGTWRTIAQSVLTKDINIRKNAAKVLKQVQSVQTEKLDEFLPEDVLLEEEKILACDNVEVAPNVKGRANIEQHIELIYKDFMQEYLSRYAKEDNLDQNQVVVGKGYSDSLNHLPQVENTFIPAAPVGYSDKTHETVYQLIPQEAKGVKKNIIERERPKSSGLKQIILQPGVFSLTFEDTLAVAYIEGKAYHDNKDLITYLHNIENGLIAKDINNERMDRPNMSVKCVGDDKKVHGYMLVYEGKVDNTESSRELRDKPIIYISDFASDLKQKGVGGALSNAFLEQYRKHYVENEDRWVDGEPLPIYAQAREQTSYAMIKEALPKYGKKYGLEFEVEEYGQEERGRDVMHKVLIKVKKVS